jgi:hypothetical protein
MSNKLQQIDSNNASIAKMEQHIRDCQSVLRQWQNKTTQLLVELTAEEWSIRGSTGSLDAISENDIQSYSPTASN